MGVMGKSGQLSVEHLDAISCFLDVHVLYGSSISVIARDGFGGTVKHFINFIHYHILPFLPYLFALVLALAGVLFQLLFAIFLSLGSLICCCTQLLILVSLRCRVGQFRASDMTVFLLKIRYLVFLNIISLKKR